MVKKSIMCVGLVTFDVVNVVDGFPVEDSDKRTVAQWRTRGGNASNMCTVLSQLGFRCEFFGSMSTEVSTEMKFIEGDFRKYDIPFAHCPRIMSIPTPNSFIIINKNNGSRTILQTNEGMPEVLMRDFDFVKFDRHNWIHFEGRPNIEELLKVMKKIKMKHPKIPLSLEFEKVGRDLTILLPFIDLLIISKEYAASEGAADMEEAVDLFDGRLEKKIMVVCPWGEHGAAGKDTDGKKYLLPACSPSSGVVDTLGAGDTFNAALIAALSSGKSFEDALRMGCKVAGFKVGRRGFSGISDQDFFGNLEYEEGSM